MRKNAIILAAVALMASSGGFFLAQILSPPNQAAITIPDPTARGADRAPSADDLLGQRRPDFTLSDMNGTPVSASDFDGHVWLANFWATWCAPCVEEMPMLSLLQRDWSDRGVKIVGIALDDADRAREFVAEMAIDYPILVGMADVVVTGRRYGNSTGLLPFSVLVDTDGIIRWTRLGALEREELERQILALR